MVPHDPAPLSPHDSRLSLSDPYTHSLSDPDTYSPRVLRPGSGDSGGGCRGSGSGSGCGDYCHHRLSLSESAGEWEGVGLR